MGPVRHALAAANTGLEFVVVALPSLALPPLPLVVFAVHGRRRAIKSVMAMVKQGLGVCPSGVRNKISSAWHLLLFFRNHGSFLDKVSKMPIRNVFLLQLQVSTNSVYVAIKVPRPTPLSNSAVFGGFSD